MSSNTEQVLNGTFRTYHDNGNIKEEGTYILGMLQGVFHEYDEDGKLIVQSYWKDHKLHGKFTHWRNVDLGILLETAMYSNDVKIYSSVFDEHSMIAGNYYFEIVDGVNRCVKSVEYKRLSNGWCVVATTIPSPSGGLHYTEEIIQA